MMNTKPGKGRTEHPVYVSLMEKLVENLEELNLTTAKILELLDFSSTSRSRSETLGFNSLSAALLLSVPDHLRKTLVAVHKLGNVTAQDVAAETGRAKSVESSYLNQLARLGHTGRKRRGERVYFELLGRE